MFENKRMYKVITPIERNGAKFWMRLGSAFTNADNSINIYLDAVPLTPSPKGGITLQIRELTAEELRESAEKRAAHQARRGYGASSGASDAAMRGTLDYNGLSPGSLASASSTASDVPF
jgi:hypothetical protein